MLSSRIYFYSSKWVLSAVGMGVLAIFGTEAGLAQLTVDPATREESRIFYQAIYPASENVASGWNGNVAAGNEGTTTTAFKNAVYLRINYFRAMAGVPANIVDNASFSAGAQKAALMMSSNNQLLHTGIPMNWLNYSSSGANAAGNSNLTLGQSGPEAITGYIQDQGTDNTAAGHRRWILYPQSTRMGTGDLPASGGYNEANALWINDAATYGDPRPAVRDGFVGWPPAGYVPYTLVYPRWSFSYAGANFSGASVSLQRNGAAVAVRQEVVANGIAENTLVFVPDNLDPNNWAGPVKPASDVTTTVNINNVIIGGSPQNFSYNVITFDPAADGADTVTPIISGSSSPLVGSGNVYSVNALTLATAYQWKTSHFSLYNAVDGAEATGPVTPVIASGYSFRDASVKAAGTYSYHLAQPGFQTGYFRINASLTPGNGAVLTFKSRLAYASNKQVAKIQISLDGGSFWNTIWSQTGSNGAGESAFQDRSVSLATYAGQEVQLRFFYDYLSGSAYTQSTDGVGWYVDNIAFINTQSLSNPVLSGFSTSRNFTLTPSTTGTYALQVRSQVYGQYNLAWSAIKAVTVTADGNPPPSLPPATRVLSVSGTLSYGSKKVKTKSYRYLAIRNRGNSPLTVTSIKYPSGFTGAWSGTIAPGASKSVKVTFYPASKRNYRGSVTLRTNATSGLNTRAISGTGI